MMQSHESPRRPRPLLRVAVDLVGVPLLVSAGYYASAFMYVFYGAFTLTGFFVWMRARGTGAPAVETAFPDPRVVEAPADR
jgi:nicotinamide mononucleotide transporter